MRSATALSASFLICCAIAKAEPLQANIQFDYELTPLKSGLREGQRLNLGATESRREITEWRRLPKWFAGTWHRERTVKYVDGRPVSYQTRDDSISGYQEDAKGRIWQPCISGLRKVEAEEYFEYQMPQRKTVYAIEKGKYTSFSLSTRIRVDKETGQIMASFQQEDMSVSMPQEDGVVKAVVDCRVFNQDGRVKFEDRIEVLEQRIEPFSPVDEFNGIDYRESFHRFLEASGHSELIPAERPKATLTETQERILTSEAKVSRLMGSKH